ncbi:MAG: hypothetical protein IPG43_06830 [Proteobacteria bacterium]|nr:hypothetical protein [Pseudomonadota bacterium]
MLEMLFHAAAIVDAGQRIGEGGFQRTFVHQRVAQRVDQGAQHHFNQCLVVDRERLAAHERDLAERLAEQVQFIGAAMQLQPTFLEGEAFCAIAIAQADPPHDTARLDREGMNDILHVQTGLQGIRDAEHRAVGKQWPGLGVRLKRRDGV